MKIKSVYKSETGKKAIMDTYQQALAGWDIAYEEIYVDTEFGETFVLAAGKKNAPPIMLLHGASSNSLFWINEVTALSENYRVYAVDRPGEPGRSAENRFNLKNDDGARWLDQVMDQLYIKKTALLGLSLGGWSAIKYAVYKPERVTALLLLAPGGLLFPRFSFIIRAIWYSMLGDKGIKKMKKLVSGDIAIPKEVVEYMTLINKQFKHRKDAPAIFSDQELAKLTMPTLVIGGLKDAIIDIEKTMQRLKKNLSSLETILLPDSYHALIGTESYIIEFLEKHKII